MSGHVYYRFKSQKEFQRIIFEGIGISVWDLKREIIQESKMGKGTDFDFAIYNADTDEEYSNDHTIIPRSSSVIARRLPPKRPGHGNAQQYVGVNLTGTNNRANPPLTAHVDWRGGGAISKDFRDRNESNPNPPQVTTFTPVLSGGERDSEAESMAAMFAAQDQQWQKTQETMATATRVGRNMGFRDRGGGPHRSNKGRGGGENGPGTSSNNSNPNLTTSNGNNNRNNHNNNNVNNSGPPPQGYICYRCGSKGHWINVCPTNDNPDFEGRPRIKRTTGIPKVFYRKWKVANLATWKQHKSVVVKNLSAADIENQRPSDPDLVCSICSKLIKNAVKMICCSSSFCESCISNYLKSHSSVCSECETKVTFSTNSNNTNNNNKAFIIDDERRKRSDDYIQEILNISQAAQLEQNKSNEDQSTTDNTENPSKPGTETQEDTSENPEDKLKSQSTVQAEEPSSSDLVKSIGLPEANQSSHTKDDSNNSPLADKSEPTQSVSKDPKPQVTILTEPSKLTPSESNKNLRSAGPGLADSSQMTGMMNGMYGNKPFAGYGPGHGMPHNGNGNMPMMQAMGMNGIGMGMGYGANGMMMDPMMMNGMGGGAGHNMVMNSNQIGFGGGIQAGNGMPMEMANGARPEAILEFQLNQVTMMLQNPQLNEPMRMQLLMQQQAIQHQMAMIQRMVANGGPGNQMMDHAMMNNMTMGNGMLMNPNHFGNPLGIHHQQQQTDFNANQNSSFGPFGMGNFGGSPGHHQLGFPTNGLHSHPVVGGVGMKPMIPPYNNQHLNTNFARPIGNHHMMYNYNNRRPSHLNVHPPHLPLHPRPTHLPTPPHHILPVHPLPSNHLLNNSTHTPTPHISKRKRTEDLIELESGEKVPRYM
ncbi:hypothetical protein H4Q26_002744 [Puccinia striiformis f. sp. tritici PST-130]|nr:hypothetical protein H4Q26_002744 [Puccinia striiformis f. sp. tritici PST-130]